MKSVAQRFMSVGKTKQSNNAESAVFGSAQNLASNIDNATSYRIAFYPIISSTDPEVAMGIATVMSYILDQYSKVTVYRILAKVELDSSNEEEEWDIAESQFSLNDWDFDGLDDNIQVYGELSQIGSSLQLRLTVDNSLLEDSAVVSIEYTANSLGTLVTQLPNIVSNIMTQLRGDLFSDQDELIMIYNQTSISDVEDNLSAIFYWNLDLYFHLWGVEWLDEEITSQFSEMLDIARNSQNSFSSWCVAVAMKQVLQIGFESIGELLMPFVDEVIGMDTANTSAILSQGLLQLGYVDDAIRVIESSIGKGEQSLAIWYSLINIYIASGFISKAIEAAQRAIENGATYEWIYARYGYLLIQAEAREIFVEELLLIDPDEYDDEEQIVEEVIAAFEKVLELNPDNIQVLHTQIPYIIEQFHDSLWEKFGRLVEVDTGGYLVRDVVEQLYDVEDLTPAFDVLTKQSEEDPNNVSVLLNLAHLAIVDDNPSLAETYIERCKQIASEKSIDTELQRLTLLAKYEDFDHHFAELMTVIGAGRAVSQDDIDFLEESIEVAPLFANLYITLAQAYIGWQDFDTALEVLQEGNTKADASPEILRLIAVVLWKKGKSEDAFTYLNQGIEQFPNDVGLLTQIATFLIENDQLDDARPYIERAEVIAPSHPYLWQIRKMIASNMGD